MHCKLPILLPLVTNAVNRKKVTQGSSWNSISTNIVRTVVQWKKNMLLVFQFRILLTITWKQYAEKTPKSIVDIIPFTMPAYMKACGIAKIPVPRHPLSKWKRVSAFLKKCYYIEYHLSISARLSNIWMILPY